MVSRALESNSPAKALSSPQKRLTDLASRPKNALVRRYITGRDVTQEMREQYVLDTFGLTHDALRDHYPDAFQRLYDRVKPEREAEAWGDEGFARVCGQLSGWIHAKTRSKFRKSTGLV